MATSIQKWLGDLEFYPGKLPLLGANLKGKIARVSAKINFPPNLGIRDPMTRHLIAWQPKNSIPKLADRLKDYIKARGIEGAQRIFPISYTAARVMVRKAGTLVGVHLRPHDLRRHAAPYASRSGVPVEIVSKVILRHAHLSTTQRCLEKVSDVESVRWIENLYA